MGALKNAENARPENDGLENDGPENAGLQNTWLNNSNSKTKKNSKTYDQM